MKRENLALKLDELEKAHQQAKKTLLIEYALANNPHKVGDIVKDHIGSIVIEKINTYLYRDGSGNPLSCCIYTGPELKKDGTPVKKNTHRGVYQTNLV